MTQLPLLGLLCPFSCLLMFIDFVL